jgi:hypothetical protein
MVESLEQRQARVERDREHEARNAEAIAAEERLQVDLHRRANLRIGAKAAPGPTSNKALPGPDENKSAGDDTGEAPNALSGVDFASDAAAEAAIKAGLTAKDFRGKGPSGARGFTAADVREIAG